MNLNTKFCMYQAIRGTLIEWLLNVGHKNLIVWPAIMLCPFLRQQNCVSYVHSALSQKRKSLYFVKAETTLSSSFQFWRAKQRSRLQTHARTRTTNTHTTHTHTQHTHTQHTHTTHTHDTHTHTQHTHTRAHTHIHRNSCNRVHVIVFLLSADLLYRNLYLIIYVLIYLLSHITQFSQYAC
jgi:hypothetical protein